MSNSKTQAAKAPQQNAAQEQTRFVYDVKIQAVYPDGGDIIADASATYNGVFAIRGLKLAKDENGPYVAMPGYRETIRDEVAWLKESGKLAPDTQTQHHKTSNAAAVA